MQVNSLPNRSWLHQVWNYKTSIIGGFLAIVSLSLAHYAGFLMKVPLHIVAVAGMPLAKSVTATFLFYLFFSAVSARVITSMLQLILLPFFAVLDRLEPGFRRRMNRADQRRFVRSHSRTIKWEGYIWLIIQALFFLLLMLGIYVKFSINLANGVALFASLAFIILSGLVRSGFFLQPKLHTFIRKIKSRPARSGRAVSGAFVTVTGALIIISFLLGGMRANLLREQEPHFVMTKEFSGRATVIASAEGSLLLFQKEGSELRYIYFSTDFTATIETKPVFSPLNIDKM
ncbi:hypothetical protein [Cellvibrio sp. OA-2007]|uniref:hypothetical protein n=1 Tax=Cellvibrio sp. OA-2007 TaxID=529823 RepID=UPI00078625F3|nr:hypothetical protein [Cellvibrio sp. OA-2007]